MNEHNCGKAAEAAYRRAVRAEQSVQRVRDMHPNVAGYCPECSTFAFGDEPWPCPFICALDGGEQHG